MNFEPIILSLKLAFVTTLVLSFFALPIAYALAFSKSKFKSFFESLVNLPLVLPPSVLGFYLLLLYRPDGWLGSFVNEVFGIQLVFSFTGLVIASVIYSFPFIIGPLQSGLQNLPNHLKEASYTMGKSPFQTYIKVLLPNIKPSIITALVMTFAHTIGEFGVVLMIGGNLSGETRVASIAIFDQVESLNYANAHQYAGVLLAITFVLLLFVNLYKNSSFNQYK
jgi:molybdate transport system permease protein